MNYTKKSGQVVLVGEMLFTANTYDYTFFFFVVVDSTDLFFPVAKSSSVAVGIQPQTEVTR